MTSNEDLERRLAALEERVDLEARMRAAMDSDIAGLAVKVTAANRLVQAVHDTQADHTGRLNRIEQALVQHGQMLGTVTAGQEAILGGPATARPARAAVSPRGAKKQRGFLLLFSSGLPNSGDAAFRRVAQQRPG